MLKLVIVLLKIAVLMALGSGQSAWACSPNLPNYGNCVRQQQQAWQMQEQYQAMQQQGYYHTPRYEEPIDLTPPKALMDKAEIAVAFNPTTGAVGVMSFAYHQSKTHYHFMAGQETFAHASCVARDMNKNLGKVNLKDAEKFLKKYGKKSTCQTIKKTDALNENLIAILRGRLPNGEYQLFMATRPSNTYLYGQEQPEFQSLLATCQAKASQCEIVGQFGDKTELY